jgi:putative DNA primase/helicase
VIEVSLTPYKIDDNPIDRVLSCLNGVERNGRGWKALCPAHDDHNPSLSVAEGDDGKVLLKCHRGCANEDVIAAIGLEMRDLFPLNGRGERGLTPLETVKP